MNIEISWHFKLNDYSDYSHNKFAIENNIPTTINLLDYGLSLDSKPSTMFKTLSEKHGYQILMIRYLH